MAARAPRPAVDPNLIAVFPFRVTGTYADAAALRESAMDLLSLALDEQAGLRVVSSRTLLARARNFSDATSVADAAAMARGVGAGAMVLANVVIVGSQLRARAEFHDLVGTRPPASVEARGQTDNPVPAIDSLAFSLARIRLASGTGVRRRPLHEFATTSPAALRLFLEGERLARLGLWQEAADSLNRAIALDSNFALAMYRLRVTNQFGTSGGALTSTQLIERALGLGNRLPDRQRDILASAWAELGGDYRETSRLVAQLALRYPDDAEAAFEIGESLFHVGLAFGEPPRRVLDAFERAIQLDSTSIEPYYHAASLRVLIGDTAGGLALARRAVAITRRSRMHQSMMVAMRAVALHEDPARIAGSDMPADAGPLLAGASAAARVMLSQDFARALAVGDAFLAPLAAPGRPPAGRAGALVGMAMTRIAEGRLAEARAILDTAAQFEVTPLIRRLRVVAATADGERLPDLLAEMRSALPYPGLQTLGLTGMAAVRLQRPALLDSVIDALDAIVRREPYNRPYVAVMTASLRGLEALDRADTAAALRILPGAWGALPHVASGEFRFVDVVQWGILALAKLEAARGQRDQALARLSYFTLATGLMPARLAADSLRATIARQPGP